MKKCLCFLSGFLLAAAMLICAVLLPALSTARFEKALLSTVDQQALGISESHLSAFAEETMQYLRGEKPAWEPDVPFPVADSFRMHMAEVRIWVKTAPWIIIGAIALGTTLLHLGGWRRKPALLGVCALVALVLLVLIWAAADFRSFWMVLHKTLIPGGIFAYDEPVMRLFPLELFFRYIVPVTLWAAGLLAALTAAGWLLLRRR